MSMTREELYKKRDQYNDRLSPREYVKAEKYAWRSTCCIAVAWVSAIVFVGLGMNVEGFSSLIVVGLIASSTSLGLGMIFEAKSALIRKYMRSRVGVSNWPYLFDVPAVKWAKFYLFLGYLFIALGIGFPLVTLVLIQAL